MILTGLEIQKQIGLNNIEIQPFNENQLNPNSYNLTLHNKLLVYNDYILDMKKDNPTTEIYIPEEGYILEPNVLYLGSTNEFVHTDNYLSTVEGRSSTARIGLDVHKTAGFIDIGFAGHITLEFQVVEPVRVYPNVPICQIIYHEVIGDITLYKGKYQNNHGVQASRIYKDFE